MSASDNLNRVQMNYRYVDQGEKKTVLAAHPTEGTVGLLNVEQSRRDNPGAGGGLRSQLAFVHPDFRRQGIATAMYNIASYQLGYKPVHDLVRTKAGDAWAKAVGGAVPEAVRMPSWDMTPEEANKNLPDRQWRNWMAGEPIEPSIAKALTPVREKKKRPRKFKQLDLGI